MHFAELGGWDWCFVSLVGYSVYIFFFSNYTLCRPQIASVWIDDCGKSSTIEHPGERPQGTLPTQLIYNDDLLLNQLESSVIYY